VEVVESLEATVAAMNAHERNDRREDEKAKYGEKRRVHGRYARGR
jgi:hypothetical protein